VGMGCLAGPVVASAVILNLEDIPKGITDSKKLSAKERERLDLEIRTRSVCFGIGVASVDEIDTVNIYHASKIAMLRAVENLKCIPDILFVDGRGKLQSQIQQLMLVKGDRLSVSIGAASIVAKVFRDQMMRKLDEEFPGYEFAKHKGYGSVLHRQHLQEKGRSPIHRKSFSWTPV
jgi:ribonuclease HII